MKRVPFELQPFLALTPRQCSNRTCLLTASKLCKCNMSLPGYSFSFGSDTSGNFEHTCVFTEHPALRRTGRPQRSSWTPLIKKIHQFFIVLVHLSYLNNLIYYKIMIHYEFNTLGIISLLYTRFWKILFCWQIFLHK